MPAAGSRCCPPGDFAERCACRASRTKISSCGSAACCLRGETWKKEQPRLIFFGPTSSFRASHGQQKQVHKFAAKVQCCKTKLLPCNISAIA